ncbi:MAG: class II fructose-bisphosphate aldolase [Candidatus Pacebacteria bacterium]|nr:class II fructose-bisphosphate aldolase [Candidatus Paceibacterota bacterium]MCF7863136.1 class II fructose-bisphosphate aldolase [Candidatus Paceibacterota bacterium]
MKTLREYIKEAEEKGVAIGHFNISNLETLHGIYAGVKKYSDEVGVQTPFVIGVSEGEEEFVGREEVSALVSAIRDTDHYPIFLNADHHYSFESVQKSIDAGYDSVIIDAVKLPLEENIALTKKCVEYAKEKSKNTGRDILVEAELGFIGQSSKLIDAVPEGVSEATMTSPIEAKSFVEATGIDMLAPSVGNVHGMVKGGNPAIHPERIKEIRTQAGVPLVLHGGSGITEEGFVSAIKAGISIVHINTELRVAYRNALQKELTENKNEIAPYKFGVKAVEAVRDVVYEKLKVFNTQ